MVEVAASTHPSHVSMNASASMSITTCIWLAVWRLTVGRYLAVHFRCQGQVLHYCT